MKIFKGNVSVDSNFIVKTEYEPDKILFFDIETTGLSRDTGRIYIIGVLFFENENAEFIQWFGDNYDDEKDILVNFILFASNYKTIIHFNGNSFDLPFICARCEKHSLSFNFDAFESVDLYKHVKPLKNILKLDNLKQKTLEDFIGIKRQDVFSGADLIHVYREYLGNKDERLEKILLLHNYEDVLNMTNLFSLLAYENLFIKRNFSITECHLNEYKAIDGALCREIIISLSVSLPLPVPLSYGCMDFYISGKHSNVRLRSKVTDGFIKFYYSNYKDYFYLPVEDTALHKSVAQFVDKNYRRKASPSTCYSKIQYEDHLTEDRDFLTKYTNSILDIILNS